MGKVVQQFEHPDEFDDRLPKCTTIYWEDRAGGVLSLLSIDLPSEAAFVPPDEGKAGDVSLARQQDEEAELLAEVDALSGSDDESKFGEKNV